MNTRFSEPVESLLSSTRAIKGLLLSVLLFACALSLRAQTSGGTVNFANNNSVPVINGGTGAAITTADGVQAALYWAPTNFGALAQIGATAVVGVPLPGLFAAGTRTSGAATPGGATGKFQVFAWSGGYQTYEEAIQHAGVLVGHSAILNVPTGNPTGDPPTPPASLVANGLQSIVLMTNVVSVCAPPTSGMISWWRGEDNGLDSIDGNHGTLVGDTTFGPGMVGQALVFDGSGDKLLVGNPANLQLQNFTIEGWVKRASATIASYGFDGEIFGYGSLGYCLGIRNNSSLFLTKVDISEVALTQAVTDTNWHHVAVTKAGTVVVFYVDGAARVTTNYNTTFVFNTPAAVGNRGDTGLDCSFLGAVDELAIYGRALSAAEILAIYSASSAGKCLVSCTPAPPGMVSWWRGENSGLDSADGNHGTLNGNETYGPGMVGLALVGDGAYDGLAVGNPGNLQLQDFTIEGWIKRASPTVASTDMTGEGLMFGFGPGGYGFGVDGSGRALLSHVNVGTVKSSPLVTDTSFHHLAVTKSGANVIFYVDAVPYPAPSLTGAFTFTTTAAVGARGSDFRNSFMGTLDEVAIYNRPLSADEILAIYNSGIAGKCPIASCASAPWGMISWWPMEGDAVDVIGGHNGTLQGSYGFAPGEVRLALNLNDNPAGFRVGDDPALNFGSNADFSIDAWIQPRIATTAYGVMDILDKREVPPASDTSSHGYEFCLVAGTLAFQMSDSMSKPFLAVGGGPDLRDGKWHYVAVTVHRSSSSGGVLYVDGSPVLTFDPTPQMGDLSNTNFLLVGLHPSYPRLDCNFRGMIDEVSLYRRALSAAEILAIYNASYAGMCPVACTPLPSDLIGWWKGDGNGVDSVAGNNGVLQNVTYTCGMVGQAFAFDPANYPYAYLGVKVPDNPAYALTNSLSIEGWIRPRGDSSAIFYRGDNRNGLDPYVMSMQGNNVLAFYINDAIGNNASVQAPLIYNQWWHVAATLDGSSGALTLYTNGVLAMQIYTTVRPFGPLIASDSPGVGIGNVNDGFNNFPFTGDVDEISLYKRALTANEVLALYHAGIAGKCLPPTCVLPPSGLVSWWRGEDNGLDSVDGNHGALVGSAAYGPGMVGRALVCDGDHDGLIVGRAGNLQLQNFTIESWIQRASTNIVSYGLLGNGVILGYGTNGYAFYLDSTGQLGLTKLNVNFVVSSSSTPITDTNFHHVAVTKTNSTVMFYIDGTAYPAAAYDPGFVFTAPAAVGARGDTLDNSFLGTVDEVSVYNRSLSAAEILAIYNAGSLGKCAPVSCAIPPWGLVSWWRGESNAVDCISGNHGFWSNDTAYAQAEVNLGFMFNGINSFIEVPDSPSLRLTNELTIEFWLKRLRLDSSARDCIVAKGGDYVHEPDYTVTLWGSEPSLDHALWFFCPGSGWASGSISNANWHHVAVTARDGDANPTFYIDGVEQAVVSSYGSLHLSPSTQPLHIGAVLDPQSGGGFFSQCLVDEVTIYNRILSAAEIQAIYLAGSAGKCVPQPCVTPPLDMVSWWRAEQNPLDYTSTNHGTLAGNATYGQGQVGWGFVFDGTNDTGVTVGSAGNLQVQDFTVEAWVKLANASQVSSLPLHSAYFFSFGAGGYGFGLNYAGRPMLSQVGGTSQTAGTIISDTNFHHLAVTKTNSTITFYVDGTAASTATFSGTFTYANAQAALGTRPDAFGNGFWGTVDELSVYDRALSASEILATYLSGICGKCWPTHPPFFTSVTPLSDRTVQLGLSASSNFTYRIYGSTNLVNWVTLTNMFNPSDLLQYVDLDATNFPHRFYRAAWMP